MAKISRQFGLVFSPTGYILQEVEMVDELTTDKLEDKGFLKYGLSTAFSKAYYKVVEEGNRTNDSLRSSMVWERCVVLEKIMTDLLKFKTVGDVFTGCVGFFSATHKEVYSVYSWGEKAVLFCTSIDTNSIEGELEYPNYNAKLIL